MRRSDGDPDDRAELETRIATLEAANRVLTDRLLRLEAEQPTRTVERVVTADDDAPGRRLVSRRGAMAMGAAVVAGAGLAAATSTLGAKPAAAAAGDPLLMGVINDAGASITTLNSAPGGPKATLAVGNTGYEPDGAVGVYAVTGGGSGLVSHVNDGDPVPGGAIGDSNDAPGVLGISGLNAGVQGYSGSGIGVYGTSESNTGVVGSGTTYGVAGESKFDSAGSGVWGVSQGSGNGVYGSTGGPGNGVVGETFGNGDGVIGIAGGTGIGMVAEGGRAQFMLAPAKSVGAPTSGHHVIGELFLDKHGALFLCVAAGRPGTWKTVQVA